MRIHWRHLSWRQDIPRRPYRLFDCVQFEGHGISSCPLPDIACPLEDMDPAPPSGPPTDNRLLAALPEENYRALLPFLEPLPLPPGMARHASGGARGSVYFR